MGVLVLPARMTGLWPRHFLAAFCGTRLSVKDSSPQCCFVKASALLLAAWALAPVFQTQPGLAPERLISVPPVFGCDKASWQVKPVVRILRILGIRAIIWKKTKVMVLRRPIPSCTRSIEQAANGSATQADVLKLADSAQAWCLMSRLASTIP